MQRWAKPSRRSDLTKINRAFRCPPAVCTSDGAEWQEHSLCLALTWVENRLQRSSVSARSSSLNVLAHDFITKEAKTNSPRVTERLSDAAGDGAPAQQTVCCGNAVLLAAWWQLTDGSRSGTCLLTYEMITRLNGTGDTQELNYLELVNKNGGMTLIELSDGY